MQLARPGIVTAPSHAMSEFRGLRATIRMGKAAVRTLGWVNDVTWVTVATTNLGAIEVKNGQVDLDGNELELLDRALIAFADTLTVSRHQPFSIMGVSPVVGILGREDELGLLCRASLGLPPAKVSMHIDDPIDLGLMTRGDLEDRPERLALLAEAMTHRNALGRYSQLLRLLERAFGRAIGKVDAQLQRFLGGHATRHHFVPSEISQWIAGRPRVLHADRSDRSIWYHRHVALMVDRLQEAAIDVLFNKANWQTSDDERRRCRVPRRGTLDQCAGMFLTRGLDFRSELHVFDPFGSFPMWLVGSVESAVPFGLWAVPDDRSITLLFNGRASDAHADQLELEPARVQPGTFASGTVVAYDPGDDSVLPLVSD